MNAHRKYPVLALAILGALFAGPSQAWASPVLDADLASFAVLGSATVTNTGTTTLTGNLGVSPGTAITGFFGTVANEGPGTFTGTAHQADAFAGSAQSQLGTAITNLGLMGPGTTLSSDLAGLTIFPGIYTVLPSTSNLTGIVTLDGQGNANAVWVFQMPSTLITSPGSFVNLINTGAGAALFWNVHTSATLDTTTSFQGNILALESITLNAGASIGCGRALASTGAVTMDTNSIGGGCTGILTGSNGLNGDLSPVGAIPEPETYAMLLAGLGLMGFVARRRKQNAA
ncbi:MAG: ice-binding family protein [Betaproteobacteria bacterium]